MTESVSHSREQTRKMTSVGIKKRIIVCCDGTWQDGKFFVESVNEVSCMLRTSGCRCFFQIPFNVHKYLGASFDVRLARTVDHEDARFNPPIPQVVFYQSGIGSEGGFYAEVVEGGTGATLGNKVEEGYAFIAQRRGKIKRKNSACNAGTNWLIRDLLFGFSRGAYTARMIAMFIGAIGVLDRRDMDHFSKIFIAYQTLAKTKDEDEIQKTKAILEPFTNKDAQGILRAYAGNRKFSIKCVGVFETVGSVGVPEELTLKPQVEKIFGFPDRILGEHIERAYHALALNETRKDFDCAKFEQTEVGRSKGQVLEQCWFTGCHSDIGGGYRFHDLADLTMAWMTANVCDILAMDLKYLANLPEPVEPWGQQSPHDPATGIFSLAFQVKRKIPTSYNPVTKEKFHPSILQQTKLDPETLKIVTEHPELVAELKPLEEEIKSSWTIDEKNRRRMLASDEHEKENEKDGVTGAISSLLKHL
ncbi:hypothetical protein K435DRAFT_959791 [Dendrothele bispora CBS 962.96]|uniref:T6SS Phospholipase effector Tle1-like catalytic domain-containing protein n=1 Tax=Dendrothele bispora (strain CBS 962.96) TaxID=1314807 RepID=A0A4S8MYB5_DENBC|nr:hypothetical protein K435DRAFT_959791 [Dendrothele bispora CBS 962.96]